LKILFRFLRFCKPVVRCVSSTLPRLVFYPSPRVFPGGLQRHGCSGGHFGGRGMWAGGRGLAVEQDKASQWLGREARRSGQPIRPLTRFGYGRGQQCWEGWHRLFPAFRKWRSVCWGTQSLAGQGIGAAGRSPYQAIETPLSISTSVGSQRLRGKFAFVEGVHTLLQLERTTSQSLRYVRRPDRFLGFKLKIQTG
jgi:hypothetical protein